jgi:MbtH protein
MHDSEVTIEYVAVINGEAQYSIWAAERDIPPGWKDAGKRGSKEECLDWIAEVWTDMRPLSLRLRLQQAAGSGESE